MDWLGYVCLYSATERMRHGIAAFAKECSNVPKNVVAREMLPPRKRHFSAHVSQSPKEACLNFGFITPILITSKTNRSTDKSLSILHLALFVLHWHLKQNAYIDRLPVNICPLVAPLRFSSSHETFLADVGYVTLWRLFSVSPTTAQTSFLIHLFIHRSCCPSFDSYCSLYSSFFQSSSFEP